MTKSLGLLVPRLGIDRRGNTAIEFGLALPILFIMLVGLLDLGNYGLQRAALEHGATEGAQYGMIAYSDSANINTTAQNATGFSGVTASNSVFCECVAGTPVSCASSCGGGTLKRYITVTTTKTFSSVLATGSTNFGSMGHFTAPTTVTASVTMSVP